MPIKLFFDGYRLKPKPSNQFFLHAYHFFVDAYRGKFFEA